MTDKKEKWENKKITTRAEDYSQWYLDIIQIADLAEYGPSKGSMVIKPYGYAIWEITQAFLDKKFKKTGVENAYFPLLIPERLLHKEKQHVEGFAPEVAVVTHAGGKKLEEPLVVRPTSETIIYDVFKNWIQSYRDLPILINQWANVVRWELRPRLFLRTTEFLWQEGHTAHATEQEADARARTMLDIYRDFAEQQMAIPVVAGRKSESEKFAGALSTYTVEAMMQDGRALQFATSHNLGQNFAKAFELEFSDHDNTLQYVWQTSWGLSTRTIGGLIMVHSDDKGLVLPPRVAPIEAVIMPLWTEDPDVLKKAEDIAAEFEKDGIRVKVDADDGRLGERHFRWEKRGVPVRVELGPRDLVRGEAILVRRDTGEKKAVKLDVLSRAVNTLLEDIQNNLLARARQYRDEKTKRIETWDEFVVAMENGNFALAHWCGSPEVEKEIKEKTGATIRCIPFDEPMESGKCILSGKPSQQRVLFAKAY